MADAHPPRRAVFDYIEVFFKRRRLHSSLGYMTPTAYENKIRNSYVAHAAQPRCPANRVNPSVRGRCLAQVAPTSVQVSKSE